MKNLSALLAGTIFGAGLVVSGMTDPQKVLAFLTIAPGWDATLIFVMGTAVLVTTLGYALIGKLTAPLFDGQFNLPDATQIDPRLLGGASVFGLGWGMAGFCPGPALVGVMTLDTRAMIFIVAYVVGVVAFEFLLGSRRMVRATADG